MTEGLTVTFKQDLWCLVAALRAEWWRNRTTSCAQTVNLFDRKWSTQRGPLAIIISCVYAFDPSLISLMVSVGVKHHYAVDSMTVYCREVAESYSHRYSGSAASL